MVRWDGIWEGIGLVVERGLDGDMGGCVLWKG